MKQYLILIKSGTCDVQTAWAFLEGDEFVRGSCTGFRIRHPKDEVTVLSTREI